MLLIVISPQQTLPNEHSILNQLIKQGLTHFHLRKPDFSKQQLENYIVTVPAEFHHNIIIHSHYELALRYNLKGIHLTEKTKQHPELPVLLQQLKKGTLSASFHTLEALQEQFTAYDYVFLSPIFNSISKHGYVTNFEAAELTSFLNAYHSEKKTTKVIALGGVAETNIHQLKNMGFDGVAVLGAIWQSADPVAVFNTLRSRLLS